MSTPKWPSLYNLGVEVIDIPHNEPIQPHGAYLRHPVDVFRFTLYWTLIFYCPVFILCGCYAFWNLNFPPAPRPHNVQSTPESRQPHKRGREEEFWPPGTSSATGAYPLSPLKPASSKPEPPPPPKPPTTLPSTSSSFPTAETFRSTTPFLPRTQAAATTTTTVPATASPHDPPPVQTPPTQKPAYKHERRLSRFTFTLLLLLLFFAAGLAGAVLGSAIVGFVASTFFNSVDYNMSTWIPFLLALLMVLTGYLSLWPSIIDIV